jgi:hypothetical protein
MGKGSSKLNVNVKKIETQMNENQQEVERLRSLVMDLQQEIKVLKDKPIVDTKTIELQTEINPEDVEKSEEQMNLNERKRTNRPRGNSFSLAEYQKTVKEAIQRK